MESKIEVRKISEREFGVFCTELIKQGESFETPCLLVKGFEVKGKSNDYLSRFWFMVDNYVRALPLHYGLIINHNSDNNIDYQFNPPRSMLFTAMRDILPGEELFINYGEDYEYNSFDEPYPIEIKP